MKVNCWTQTKAVRVVSMRNMMCANRDDDGVYNVQVNDTYFLGKNMYNYSALKAAFTGLSGPQNSA